MRDDVTDRLQERLLERGVAAREVRRLLRELDDHFEDLVAAAVESGMDRRAAEAEAERQLGSASDIERAVLAQPDLRSWAWRWPLLASIVYPAAWVAALPVVGIVAGMRHADSIVRWMVCLAAGATVTATMLLVLQLTISPG